MKDRTNELFGYSEDVFPPEQKELIKSVCQKKKNWHLRAIFLVFGGVAILVKLLMHH